MAAAGGFCREPWRTAGMEREEALLGGAPMRNISSRSKNQVIFVKTHRVDRATELGLGAWFCQVCSLASSSECAAVDCFDCFKFVGD